MSWKERARLITNALVRCAPSAAVRYVLKSYWYQPELQNRIRFHVQPYRFDSAIPTCLDVDNAKLRQRRTLLGFTLHTERHLQLLGELSPYVKEFQFPLESSGGDEFWFRNASYEDLDATLLYCMVRHFKPTGIIEVGCGFSSRVISIAARRNAAEGQNAECTFIEPYPTDRIRRETLAGPLVEKPIEDMPLEFFQKLGAGDFLFIDTSHVLKTQSDCCYEYTQILPSLRAGVFVHVHDIFTPYDYPEEWIFQKQFPFNEQYVLEALLSGNPSFEVLLPLYQLWREQPESLKPFFRGKAGRPGAFWMRTRDSKLTS
jgi:hypothetical protein